MRPQAPLRALEACRRPDSCDQRRRGQGRDECALKEGEDVLDRFVDGTRLAAGFLNEHEYAGGHVKREHVRQELDDLLRQLNRKPQASSFPTQELAEIYIQAAMLAKLDEITTWYQSKIKRTAIPHSTPFNTGVGVTRQRRMLANYSGVLTVLERMENCKIRIVTSHPKDAAP